MKKAPPGFWKHLQRYQFCRVPLDKKDQFFFFFCLMIPLINYVYYFLVKMLMGCFYLPSNFSPDPEINKIK